MNNQILNLITLQLILLAAVIILAVWVIYVRKKSSYFKMSLGSIDKTEFDYKKLEPLIQSFSELNEMERLQLSTMLNGFLTEQTTIRNEKNGVSKGTIKDEIEKIVVLKKPIIKKQLREKNQSSENSFLVESIFEKPQKPYSFMTLKEILQSRHESLNEHEIELCIYVYEGKSCLEIAEMTGLTSGSVRVYKNKLKMKLNLPRKVTLSQYLATL